MAVKIRLKRMGSKKAPFYRIVVADSRSPRDGKVLERLGSPSPPISSRLEHIIITGMFNTYFEIVLHQMPWEEAVLYLEEMQAFYTAGWMKLMGQE